MFRLCRSTPGAAGGVGRPGAHSWNGVLGLCRLFFVHCWGKSAVGYAVIIICSVILVPFEIWLCLLGFIQGRGILILGL